MWAVGVWKRATAGGGRRWREDRKLITTELNKTRKPWDADKPYEITQSPDPNYKPGGGITEDVSLEAVGSEATLAGDVASPSVLPRFPNFQPSKLK